MTWTAYLMGHTELPEAAARQVESQIQRVIEEAVNKIKAIEGHGLGSASFTGLTVGTANFHQPVSEPQPVDGDGNLIPTPDAQDQLVPAPETEVAPDPSTAETVAPAEDVPVEEAPTGTA